MYNATSYQWLFNTGGSFAGSLLQIVCILVDIAIYWVFYQGVEKQNKAMEANG